MEYRVYPLPVSATEAPDMFPPIATAASNLGYLVYQQPNRVIVQPDENTKISYMIDNAGNFSMVVLIEKKDVPGGLDAAYAAGKLKGDDIWNRAVALRPGWVQRPPPNAPQAQPGVQININP